MSLIRKLFAFPKVLVLWGLTLIISFVFISILNIVTDGSIHPNTFTANSHEGKGHIYLWDVKRDASQETDRTTSVILHADMLHKSLIILFRKNLSWRKSGDDCIADSSHSPASC